MGEKTGEKETEVERAKRVLSDALKSGALKASDIVGKAADWLAQKSSETGLPLLPKTGTTEQWTEVKDLKGEAGKLTRNFRATKNPEKRKRYADKLSDLIAQNEETWSKRTLSLARRAHHYMVGELEETVPPKNTQPEGVIQPSKKDLTQKAKTEVNTRTGGGHPPDAVSVTSDIDGRTYYYKPETGEMWDEKDRRMKEKDIYRWTHVNSVEALREEVRRELDDLILGGRPRYENRILNGRMDIMMARARELVEIKKQRLAEASPDQKASLKKEDEGTDTEAVYQDLRREYLAVRMQLMWWYEAVLSHSTEGGFGRNFGEGIKMGSEDQASLMEWLFTNYRSKELFEGMGRKTPQLNIDEEQNPNQILGKMLRLGSALASKDGATTRKVKLTTREGEEAIILFNPNVPGYKDSGGEVNVGMTWLYEMYRTHNFDSYLLGYLKTRHKNLSFAFEDVGYNEEGKSVYIFHASDTWFHAYNLFQMVEMAPFWANQLHTLFTGANGGDQVLKDFLTSLGWDFKQTEQANIDNLTADKNQLIMDNLIYCRLGEFKPEHWQMLKWVGDGDPNKKEEHYFKNCHGAPLNHHATMEGYMRETREVLRQIMCNHDVAKNLEALDDPNTCWKHIREPNWSVRFREMEFWESSFDRPMLRSLQSYRNRGHRDAVANLFKERIPQGLARAILRKLDFASEGIKTGLGAEFIDWKENAIMMEDYHVARQTLQYVSELKVIDVALRGFGVDLEDFVTYAGLKIKRFSLYNMAFNLREMRDRQEIANNPKARAAWIEYHNIRPAEREQWAILNPDKAIYLFKFHPQFNYEVDQKLWQEYLRMNPEQRQAWLTRTDDKGRPAAEIGNIFQVCLEYEQLGENDEETKRLVYQWSESNGEKAFKIHELINNFPFQGGFDRSERGKLEMRTWFYQHAGLASEYEDNPQNPRTDYGSNNDEFEKTIRVAWRAERARFSMDLRNDREKKFIWVKQTNGTYKKIWDPRDVIVGRFVRDQVDFNPQTLDIRLWQEENSRFFVFKEEKYLTAEELLLSESQRTVLLGQRLQAGTPAYSTDYINELRLIRERERLGLNPIDSNLYGTGPYLPGYDRENSILYTDWNPDVIVGRYFARGSIGFWMNYARNRSIDLSKREGVYVSPDEVWERENLDRRIQTPAKRWLILYALNKNGTLDYNESQNLMVRYGCSKEQAEFFLDRCGSFGVEDIEGKAVGTVDATITQALKDGQAELEKATGFKLPIIGTINAKTIFEFKVAARNLLYPVGANILFNQANFLVTGTVLGTGAALSGFLTSFAVGAGMVFLGMPRGERVRSWKYFGGKIFGTLGAIEAARSPEQIINSTFGQGKTKNVLKRILKKTGEVLWYWGGIDWASDDDDATDKLVQAISDYKFKYGGYGKKD